MKNNWLKSNKLINFSVCDTTECNVVIALKAENEKLKAENEELKRLINMHLTTFDKCCSNGLIMSNTMSKILNE